mmetsp:Transcript_38195/g.70508  ORF Transcript_38195/g.70508 Transcript_38195/m.70508 type:complete len:214 (-) Transcript_38195:170-811(-)
MENCCDFLKLQCFVHAVAQFSAALTTTAGATIAAAAAELRLPEAAAAAAPVRAADLPTGDAATTALAARTASTTGAAGTGGTITTTMTTTGARTRGGGPMAAAAEGAGRAGLLPSRTAAERPTCSIRGQASSTMPRPTSSTIPRPNCILGTRNGPTFDTSLGSPRRSKRWSGSHKTAQAAWTVRTRGRRRFRRSVMWRMVPLPRWRRKCYCLP